MKSKCWLHCIVLFLFGFIAPFSYAQNALSLHSKPVLTSQDLPLYIYKGAHKGGVIVNGTLGTFDTLNPFNLKGVAGPEIRHFTIESLFKRHMNEPFALYPWLAKEVKQENDSLIFTLNENAKFSDGEALEAKHILNAYHFLKQHGRPNFRTYYGKVSKIEALDKQTVKFTLQDLLDKELPLIIALMPIFKMQEAQEFTETTLKPLIGTGAYTITNAKIGERLTLTRNQNWWAKDLPLNVGQQNFETLHFDFYRDQTAYFEAFKKGLVDWRIERDPQKWAEIKALSQIKTLEIETGMPLPFKSYHFNTRKSHLFHLSARKALHILFDGEQVNQNIYAGSYKRLTGSFTGSELDGALPPFKGSERERLRAALTLFKEAGFTLSQGKLHDKNGKVFTLEFITNSKEQERLALATCGQFQKAGVICDIRLLDSAQYQARALNYDFDVIEFTNTNSLSPGNEQLFYWSSGVANEKGSRNYSGLRHKYIDEAIDALLKASTREELIARAKDFDKALMETYVALPLFQPPKQWLAFHKTIGVPEKQSLYGYLPETWWRLAP